VAILVRDGEQVRRAPAQTYEDRIEQGVSVEELFDSAVDYRDRRRPDPISGNPNSGAVRPRARRAWAPVAAGAGGARWWC